MMPQPPDDTIHIAPIGRRWMIPGGEEDETSVTLYVLVSDGFAATRYEVMIPLGVSGADELVVGAVAVTRR